MRFAVWLPYLWQEISFSSKWWNEPFFSLIWVLKGTWSFFCNFEIFNVIKDPELVYEDLFNKFYTIFKNICIYFFHQQDTYKGLLSPPMGALLIAEGRYKYPTLITNTKLNPHPGTNTRTHPNLPKPEKRNPTHHPNPSPSHSS